MFETILIYTSACAVVATTLSRPNFEIEQIHDVTITSFGRDAVCARARAILPKSGLESISLLQRILFDGK